MENAISLADSGALNDITAPYVNRIKQQSDAQAQVDKEGLLGMAKMGAVNSAIGFFGTRMGYRMAADELETDDAFVSDHAARVTKENPSSTGSEREFLAGAKNSQDYTWRKELLDKHHKDEELLQSSYTGSLAGVAVDMLPDIAVGVGVAGRIARMAAGGARIGTAFGVNATQGAVSEYLRQKASLEDTNARAIILSSLVSGGMGAVFDGLSGKSLADARHAADDAAKHVVGAKPVASIEAEVLQEGADKAVPTAAAVVATEGRVAAREAGDATAVSATSRATSAAAAEAVSAIKDYAAKHIETLNSVRASQAAANEFPDTAFSLAFQSAQVNLEAKVAKQAAKVGQAGADTPAVSKTTSVSGDTPTGAKGMTTGVSEAPAVPQNIIDVEAVAQAAVTSGRLVLTEANGSVFKPRFESPVDRALATVGSQTTQHELSVASLDLLRQAFPKEADEALVKMSEDFVQKHLLPTLRAGGKTDPQVPRWWDKMDPKSFRAASAHISAADFPGVKQWAESTPVTAASLSVHELDAGGAKLQASVMRANQLVTQRELDSGFAALTRNPSMKALADNMNVRLKAFTEATGGKADAHLVKSWMAQELYNRAMFESQKVAATAAKVGADTVGKRVMPPIVGKVLLITGGAVVLSLVVATAANAGNGGASAGGGEGAAALVGVLVGAKFLKKSLSKVGKGADLAAKLKEADKMNKAFAKAGTNDTAAVQAHAAAVEAKTGMKVVNGAVHYSGSVADLKASLDTTTMSVDQVDQFVSGLKVTDQTTGETLTAVSHFDGDKVLKVVQDMSASPLIKTVANVWGKTYRIRTPGFASEIRADFQRLADDPSKTIRGLAHFMSNSTIGREGKVANELTSDVLVNKFQVEYASKSAVALKDGLKEWRKEKAIEAPHLLNRKAHNTQLSDFDREVALAKRSPGDPRVSKAAQATADKFYQMHVAVVNEAKQARAFMESKGIKLAEDDPVRLMSEMKVDKDAFPLIVSQTKVKEVSSQIGEDGIKKLLARSIRSAVAGVSDAHVEAIARRMHDALFTEKDRFGAFMTKRDGAALTADLQRSGVPKNVIEDIKALFGTREMGKATQGNIKLDLDTEMEFMVDGKPVKVKLADLYEDSMTRAFERWSRSTTGAISMALPGAHVGVNLADDAQWALLMRKARSEGASEYAMDALQAYRDRVLGHGKDASVFGNPGTINRMTRGLGNYWLGSDFVFAQVPDGAAALGPGIVLKFFRNVPACWKLNKGILDGSVSLEELQHIRSMTGSGMDSVSASVANMADGIEAPANFVDSLGHMQRKLSGMEFFGNFVADMSAKEMQDNLLRYAFTGKIDERLWKHYAVYGIDKVTADAMAPMLRQAAEGWGGGGFKGVSKEALQDLNYDLAKRYEMALYRRGKSVNGEAAGWGEGARWFRASELGQFVHQLQGSSLLITQRTQRDIANFDGLVLQSWISSFGFAMMAYMAKTGISYYNNQEELNKRLTASEIFKAGIRQSSFSGIWPNLVDAGLLYGLQRDPLFANSATKGSGELAIQGAIKKPIAAIGGVMGLVTGKHEDNFTQKEAKALKETLVNVWWLNPAVTFLSTDLPTGNEPAPKK